MSMDLADTSQQQLKQISELISLNRDDVEKGQGRGIIRIPD